MTIVAGFKSPDGIVLCADTQETLGGIAKRNVPKLRFEPRGSYRMYKILAKQDPDDLAVAFCGATDNGPYLDMLIDSAWEACQHETTLEGVSLAVKESIKNTYREYGAIYQSGQMPSTELIYGVKSENSSKLFYAFGPAVTETDKYAVGGVGSYMADFLASRMYDDGLSLRQGIALAAYVLYQAKEHVEGCGGDSHIAVLRNEGTSGLVNFSNVQSVTKLVRAADRKIGEILMQYANMELTRKDFVDQSVALIDQLASVREGERENLAKDKELWDAMFGTVLHDDIGLPTPFATKALTKKGDDKKSLS